MSWRVAEHSDYRGKGGKADWDAGVLPVFLDSWDEFGEEVARLLDLGDFVWRGQRQDWPLVCKFYRIVKRRVSPQALEDYADTFLRAIRGRRGSSPPPLTTKRIDEIWTLGQHYGLPTPLLDWTESPFVAAYFAFEAPEYRSMMTDLMGESLPRSLPTVAGRGAIDFVPYRWVYGFSKDIIRWGPAEGRESPPKEYFVQFVDTLSDENPRLLSQRGLFTKSLYGEIPIEDTVRRCYAADVSKNVKRIILVKISIPEVDRAKCLRDLDRMNINHATLFPDLIGAAGYCAMKLEIDNY